MKIAFLHFYSFRLRRGIEKTVLSLANALSEKGEDVTVIGARRSFDPFVLPAPRLRLREFPTFRYFEFKTIAPFYLATLMLDAYDVVNIFFADFGEGYAIPLAKTRRDFKLNLYFCYPYAAASHRYHSFVHFGMDKSASRLLAHSKYVAEDVQAFFHRPAQVLPAGTDPNLFYPDFNLREETRQRLGWKEDDIVLLTVASLEERKGVQRVLASMARLSPSVPSLHYIIFGEGPFGSKLRSMVKELGLDDRVVFGGVTSNLLPYYNAADIFVLLSEYEANSIACLEAMASGLPVVATHSGGFLEVVDSTLGRLVNIADPSSIDSAIEELAGDIALRRKLGAAARQKVIQNLSWTRIAEQALDIFREEMNESS